MVIDEAVVGSGVIGAVIVVAARIRSGGAGWCMSEWFK
jgi:hypothetical protein